MATLTDADSGQDSSQYEEISRDLSNDLETTEENVTSKGSKYFPDDSYQIESDWQSQGLDISESFVGEYNSEFSESTLLTDQLSTGRVEAQRLAQYSVTEASESRQRSRFNHELQISNINNSTNRNVETTENQEAPISSEQNIISTDGLSDALNTVSPRRYWLIIPTITVAMVIGTLFGGPIFGLLLALSLGVISNYIEKIISISV